MTTPQERPFSLRVLGGLELRDRSGRSIELRTRKSRLLLAFLAVPAGQARRREQLATLLWSDRQDEQARSSLRTALSDIRRAVGNDALLVDRDTVLLRPDFLMTDYEQLRQAASEETGSVGEPAGVYPGEFLAGHDYDDAEFASWLRALRAECLELAVKVLGREVSRRIAGGENQLAIEYARQLLALDPLREQTHRTLMRLYAESGERSLAIAQFRNCCELLQRELSAEPSPETKALADAIALRDTATTIDLERLRGMPFDPWPQINVDPAKGGVQSRLLVDDNDSPSIAVLPFVNMSGDAEQDYFADGITEDIVTDLSRVEELSVAAITSTRGYRGVRGRPDQISRELGVRYILDGSVRKSGQNVRVTAQLVDGRTGRQLWAERYDRQLVAIFDLQSEVAGSIVSALKLSLSRGTDKVVGARGTNRADAYHEYLRGRGLLREMTRRSVELSREMFKQAVIIDPNYAEAYAGLADSASMLAYHYDVPPSVLESAIADSHKALSINPALAEAHCSLGRAYSLSLQTDAAEAEFRTAIELEPRLQEAHLYRGLMRLMLIGRPDLAIGSLRVAFDLANQDLQTGLVLMNCLRGLDRPRRFESGRTPCFQGRTTALEPEFL